MADKEKSIAPYPGPAGGWDALKRSWQALREEHIAAFGAKTLLRTNQARGFDCPGCAWPDRNRHSTFEFCENGVKAVAAEATRSRATRDFFATHTVAELDAMDDHALEAQGRLTEPMAYDAATDKYVPVAWDAAFAKIAAALKALDHPDQALFYTSGRTSNEAAFLYQLFVREFGTNNLPDCSNLCHEASGIALGAQIGSGKGSVLLEDFEQAQAIFIFGQNPGTNHPRMLGELRDAAKRGCRIVVFNPLRERGLERFASPQHAADMLGGGVAIASHYYQPRIGGDLAAITGIAKVLLNEGAVDHAFIAAHTDGFAPFRASIECTAWSAIEAQSGLSRAQLEQAAHVYRDSPATIVCWGMGITQHRRSVATIQMLMGLLLLRGNVGKPGAGPCPVRGHSNVQGDRTMGIHEKPEPAFLDRIATEFGFAPPRAHGMDVVAAIEAMHAGTATVFFAMGGNFAMASPDTALTHAALRRCALTAHVSTKLNRSHLVHGREALILPCLGRSEVDLQAHGPQAVSVEDSMSMVHLSEGMNAPASEHLLSEPAIVARLAEATLGSNSKVPWRDLVEDYDRIRDRIARVIDGFADFNERVRVDGGFHLPHPARTRTFPTASGKARFFAHGLEPAVVGATQVAMPFDAALGEDEDGFATRVAPTSPEALLRLMTIRSHDQYNTTIYGLDDRYRGVHGYRRVLFIARADLDRLGLVDGGFVDVHSVWHDGERTALAFRLVQYDIPAGCVAAYFPETNALVPIDSFAEHARTPTSKDIPVRLVSRPAPELPA
ncbi:MAG: FdhF/YdeP family oxidoreductase [Arenimonas sp.]